MNTIFCPIVYLMLTVTYHVAVNYAAIVIPPLSERSTNLSILQSSTGTCKPLNGTFYNIAQRQTAMLTGSIKSLGLQIKQDFSELCTDVALRQYRTVDGSCNHPKNWGTSFTPVARILPSAYDDDVNSPRTLSVNGNPLPSPRTISNVVHPDVSDPSDRTIMIMQWGQWLDHDVTGFPVITEPNKTISCCGVNGTKLTGAINVNCFPITLPADEVNFAGSCMQFVRSVPATDKNGCQLSPREQVNSLTSFVDASQIYGSTKEVAAAVRNGTGIFLKTKNGNFLPEDPASGCILRPNSKDYCFLAGDVRVNEHPALGAMHTIWLRAHNSIAKDLKSLRPSDNDETIFQLTRKIIGALQQVITYNEWLPIILGKDAINLKLVSKTGRTKRLAGVDPRILNEFSTAAMRFGHSFIPGVFPIGDRRVPLRELFNRPAEVLDNLDDLVAGVAGVGTPSRNIEEFPPFRTVPEEVFVDLDDIDDDFGIIGRNKEEIPPFRKRPIKGGHNLDNHKAGVAGVANLAEKIDRNFVEEVTNHLFEPPAGPPGRGLDLISLNIQRARDHGIPPYTAFRAVCGLRPLTGFKDTEALGPFAAQLGRVYKSVDDIDLFTGLVHEPPETGSEALVGPTLSCILGTQFYNLKFGDRFFFDTDEKLIAFTDAQLESLRNVSLAKIICGNTNITALPENVFSPPGRNNPLTPCNKLVADSLALSLFA